MTIRRIGRTITGAVLMLIAASSHAQAQTNNTATRADGVRFTEAVSPAPLQERPLFRWSGVYFGGTAGFGGGNADTTFLVPDGPPFSPDTLSPTTRGGTLGVYGGVNFQAGIFVSGIDVDLMFSAMDGSAEDDDFAFAGLPAGAATMSATQKIDWYSTVRGRAGIGVGGMLWYGTAGIVIERLDHSSNVRTAAVQFPVVQVDTKYGWTAGGGMEGRFGRVVTWRVQYLYLDLGSSTATGDPVPDVASFSIDHTWVSTSHVFSAGIGFKF
jgi:outer membrane immunogenic protein